MSETSFGEFGIRHSGSSRFRAIAIFVAAIGVGFFVRKRSARPADFRRRRALHSMPFSRLRGELLEKSRREIFLRLGPPPTAMGLRAMPGQQSIWNAVTWYYPFDVAEQSAIAIGFERDRAKKIELIGSVVE